MMRGRSGATRGKPPAPVTKSVTAPQPVDITAACNQWYDLAQKELAIFQNYNGRTPLPNWIPKQTDYADEKNTRQIFCFIKQGEWACL